MKRSIILETIRRLKSVYCSAKVNPAMKLLYNVFLHPEAQIERSLSTSRRLDLCNSEEDQSGSNKFCQTARSVQDHFQWISFFRL